VSVKFCSGYLLTQPSMLYKFTTGSWLAWTSCTSTHYMAIHCPR